MSGTRTENDIIAEAYSDEAAKNWRAPVQGYGGGIPWSLHLEAYEAYCRKWSKQTALIDLRGRGCRGGFGTGELDDFVPGWRDRVSYIGRLESRVQELEARTGDSDALVEALVLFRAFIQRNVSQWQTGAGDHHHPMWEHVATALHGRPQLDTTHGPAWGFIQPENRTSLDVLQAKASS